MSDGRRIAPLSVGLVLLAIVSIQCGAAIAISIFDRVGFAGAVLLRNLLAGPGAGCHLAAVACI